MHYTYVLLSDDQGRFYTGYTGTKSIALYPLRVLCVLRTTSAVPTYLG